METLIISVFTDDKCSVSDSSVVNSARIFRKCIDKTSHVCYNKDIS